ncbi:MAG: UDP-3-O-(3-hydroxymyristoyl)glucosamine N-acyltransferase [Ekhidna sp.]|nr:UDP-3-O-(3-hydroxymyristoyl)glucosamine N-acyltransferase [Ekhidna sp.]
MKLYYNMKAPGNYISKYFGIEVRNGEYVLGLSNSNASNTLSFLDDPKFLDSVQDNESIIALIVTQNLAEKVERDIELFIMDDPRFDYYTMHNDLARAGYQKNPSIIHESATIQPTAYVSEYNVKIEENVEIQPNVTILTDVEIGSNSIIRSGAVIGAEGFEYKRTLKGILPVFHDGKVIIGEEVDIGANCAVSKGFSYRNTMIGNQTKLDNLVHVAHGVQIGERCLLPASCMIAGSTSIGDDVWIGPNASVSSWLTIESNAFITMGSVVTKNVEEGSHITGNFAIPHSTFLNILKKNINEIEGK